MIQSFWGALLTWSEKTWSFNLGMCSLDVYCRFPVAFEGFQIALLHKRAREWRALSQRVYLCRGSGTEEWAAGLVLSHCLTEGDLEWAMSHRVTLYGSFVQFPCSWDRTGELNLKRRERCFPLLPSRGCLSLTALPCLLQQTGRSGTLSRDAFHKASVRKIYDFSFQAVSVQLTSTFCVKLSPA